MIHLSSPCIVGPPYSLSPTPTPPRYSLAVSCWLPRHLGAPPLFLTVSAILWPAPPDCFFVVSITCTVSCSPCFGGSDASAQGLLHVHTPCPLDLMSCAVLFQSGGCGRWLAPHRAPCMSSQPLCLLSSTFSSVSASVASFFFFFWAGRSLNISFQWNWNCCSFSVLLSPCDFLCLVNLLKLKPRDTLTGNVFFETLTLLTFINHWVTLDLERRTLFGASSVKLFSFSSSGSS